MCFIKLDFHPSWPRLNNYPRGNHTRRHHYLFNPDMILLMIIGIPSILHAANAEFPKTEDQANALQQEEAFQQTAANRPSSWIVLPAGDLGVILDRKDDGVEVLSVFDLAGHRQLMAKEPLPLFAIMMRHLESGKDLTLVANTGWRQTRATLDDCTNSIDICWQTPKDESLKNMRVVATATLDRSAGAIRWKLAIDHVDKGWSVRRVQFPQIALDMSSPQFTFFYPQGPGTITRGPRNGWYTRPYFTYPAHCVSMQYIAAYDPQFGTGLYCAMHDPQGATKDIRAKGHSTEQAALIAFDVPAENMNRGGNGYVLPGEGVWQAFRGDWFDAAMIYRAWVRQNARWYPKLTADGRADTPQWMRELPVWFVFSKKTPESVASEASEIAKTLEVPVGVAWYHWHEIPFDNDYPHYFPTDAGFGEAVRKLQQTKNIYVMPYINGRLWDTHDKLAEDFEFTRIGLPAATKDEPGNPYIEQYNSKEADGSPVQLAVMCPATKLWQETIRQIVLQLMNECGCKGVYIDQVASERPMLCFDRTHGHPLGGGHWWTESYNDLLEAIRREKPVDCMLTTESNAEPYLKNFDGYLSFHWCRGDQVPAFPAVYGGAIQMFGRMYGRGDTKELRTKAGQQLVYGEQIGWFNPNVIQDKESLEFLRQVIGLRWQLRRYFYAGEMARPPKLEGAIPTVTADWKRFKPGLVTTDAVMAGVWALPQEHRCILLFTNVSDQPVTAKLRFDAAEYGFSSKQIKITPIMMSGADEPFTSPRSLQQDLTFPARSAFAWEITQE